LDQLSIGGFQESLQTVIATKLDDCMHYEPPAGRLELRRQICLVLASQGIVADEDEIIITSGAQQGIDLAIRMLCQAGTSVAIERPAYYGAINAFRCAQTRILEVPLTDDGMDLDILQKYLESNGARLIYTNPTFHNPTGVTASIENRRALLALAKRYDAIILEDDHSSELRFSGEPVPAIRCLDENGDNVIYVRSFGKTFLPGVRLGFLAVPSTLRQRLLFTKASADLHCNGLLQEAVAEHLRHGRHLVALDRLRETYAGHQSVLRAAITAGLPEEASLSSPSGGLSFWLTLPKRADTSELYFSAVRRGVSFVDGDAFYASRSNERSIRVSFGLSKPSELLEGADRLCAAIKDLLTTRRTRDLAMT
jgi:DNA-binding transcriptional MocR family regulator